MIKLVLAVLLATALQTVNAQSQPTPKPAKTCKGTTVKGAACKSTILLKDGYCRAHSPLSPRCGATNSKGKPCKMVVKKAGDKCRHHVKD